MDACECLTSRIENSLLESLTWMLQIQPQRVCSVCLVRISQLVSTIQRLTLLIVG